MMISDLLLAHYDLRLPIVAAAKASNFGVVVITSSQTDPKNLLRTHVTELY